MIEQHYTIAEVSESLKLSLERVRQLVMNEPGVIRLAPENTKGKKTMYRIPASVLQRILKRNANPA